MWVLWSVISGILFAEFIGYWIHRLIHSGKIDWLSVSHMEHHLREYGPKMPQRTDKYKLPNVKSIGVTNLGLEFFVPVAVVAVFTFILLLLFGVSFKFVSLFMLISIIWGIFMFSYMHDSFHLKKFWMSNDIGLFKWFKRVRRLHDIHHMRVNDYGRMDCNFGICFFGMDKLFGTYKHKLNKVSERGLDKLRETYSHIYDEKHSRRNIQDRIK